MFFLVSILFICVLTGTTSQKNEVKILFMHYGFTKDSNHRAQKAQDRLYTITKEQETLLAIFPEIPLQSGMSERNIATYATNITSTEEPCDEDKHYYPKFMQELSCAAKQTKTMVITNVIQEKDKKFYPADLVIRGDGLILHSNLRENQIGNDNFNHHSIPFEIPANKYFAVQTEDAKVNVFSLTSPHTGFKFSVDKMIPPGSKQKRTYVVPGSWVSQLPFLTSLQVHQMFAQEQEITMIVSATNNPKQGQGGVGVYHATAGPLLTEYVPQGGTKLYNYSFTDADVPGIIEPPPDVKDVDQLGKEMDDFKMEVDPDVPYCKSKILKTSVPTTKTIVCFRHKRNKICCHFHISIFFNRALSLKGKFYTYHLVAYKGFKNYYNVFSRGGVEICGIIACLDSKLESCGKRFGHYDEVIWPVLFKNITIKANFTEGFCPPSRPCTQYPNSLLSSMRPIHTNFTKWETKVYPDQKHPILEKTFSLVEPQDRLFTFAIFGRNFSMKPTKRSGYENLVIANFWITVTFPYLCSII
ncbi:hypothetical protein MTP99_009337 [Tenebrio molitor]|nr:hypothetical protein MTP99_009337 [Tenebrio molitor]